jgi:3-deoxy-manno-octulosonate cytidylyltransferase (CMP-KDO synthetase)
MSKKADYIFVAACDKEIQEEVQSFGGNVIMTRPEITRPGLRVAEASEELDLADDDIVVVVQGDEPLVHPDMIDLAVQPLLDEDDVFVSNLSAPIDDENEWKDPGEIKVVTNLQGDAIYMSRTPIPSTDHEEVRGERLKQVCIMPFRWHFMKKFNAMQETPLELAESIEMIRAIQHGYKVRMVPSPFNTKSVDTEQDRQMAEELMKSDPLYPQYK